MAKMGRPKTDKPRSQAMTMRLLPGERERLEYYAEKLGISKTKLITDALERYYEQIESQSK